MKGILVVDGASAFIEKNLIGNSLKANIAYGGERSADTIILGNDIFGSRSEGIFIIEGGYSWIWRNRIHDNTDGIIVADSSPFIKDNLILANKRCGVILTSQSYPKIECNQIQENYTCGILVKENSYGVFKKNTVICFNFYHELHLAQE